jgi:hypothetical protein
MAPKVRAACSIRTMDETRDGKAEAHALASALLQDRAHVPSVLRDPEAFAAFFLRPAKCNFDSGLLAFLDGRARWFEAAHGATSVERDLARFREDVAAVVQHAERCHSEPTFFTDTYRAVVDGIVRKKLRGENSGIAADVAQQTVLALLNRFRRLPIPIPTSRDLELPYTSYVRVAAANGCRSAVRTRVSSLDALVDGDGSPAQIDDGSHLRGKLALLAAERIRQVLASYREHVSPQYQNAFYLGILGLDWDVMKVLLDEHGDNRPDPRGDFYHGRDQMRAADQREISNNE